MPRIFIGTFLEGQALKQVERLAKSNEGLEALWQRKVKWVSGPKLHITWLFIGDVEKDAVGPIQKAMKSSLASMNLEDLNLSIRYDRLELWPKRYSARLGVLVAKEPSSAILNIQSTLRDNLKEFLPSKERDNSRKFQPHITVMRIAKPLKRKSDSPSHQAVRTDVVDADLPEPIEQKIDEIHLIESDLGKIHEGYIKLCSV